MKSLFVKMEEAFSSFSKFILYLIFPTMNRIRRIVPKFVTPRSWLLLVFIAIINFNIYFKVAAVTGGALQKKVFLQILQNSQENTRE